MVLTGGGAKLNGILETAKTSLRLPVSLGIPIGINSIIDEINDPAMSTAIGLVVYGYEKMDGGNSGGLGSVLNKIKDIKKIGEMIKKFFNHIKP